MSANAVERTDAPSRASKDTLTNDERQWQVARARVAELLATTDLQDRIDEAFEVEEIIRLGGTPAPSNDILGEPLVRKGA